MSAAMVAVATTCTAASRTPTMIIGSASGSSTRRSSWPPDIPMPCAASRAAASTSRKPT
jgi:hypothetical protein